MSLALDRATKMGKYVVGTLVRPNTTFANVLAEPSPMGYGFAAVLLTGSLYTLTVIFGYINGFGAVVRPWIPIAAQDYYLYQAFFVLPVVLVSTLVYAAVVQFLSVFLGGKGNFENCVAVAGFSLWITIIPLMWIPETITMVFLPHLRTTKLGGILGLPPTLDLARQVIAFMWQITVTMIGLKQVHQYSWLKTVVIGIIGYVVYWAVCYTYVR